MFAGCGRKQQLPSDAAYADNTQSRVPDLTNVRPREEARLGWWGTGQTRTWQVGNGCARGSMHHASVAPGWYMSTGWWLCRANVAPWLRLLCWSSATATAALGPRARVLVKSICLQGRSVTLQSVTSQTSKVGHR